MGLVNRGADINVTDRWGGSPLDDAIRSNQKNVIAFLKENGAKIGDEKKVSANLFTAIENNDLDSVKTLIESGANVKAVDYDMRTPLHVAVAVGSDEIIQALHKAGADINAVDNFGLTPLSEAARHGKRTGENKINNLLIGLGAVNTYGGEKREHATSKIFVICVGIMQLLFLIFFSVGTEYDSVISEVVGNSTSPDRIKTTYGMFQDVHVMIFIGFGFLMTFLRKHNYSSVGMTFLVSALCIQWHILVGGFFEHLIVEGHLAKIHVSLETLIFADFACGAVLITYGVLLGKVSPFQLLFIALFEVIFFAINESIGL